MKRVKQTHEQRKEKDKLYRRAKRAREAEERRNKDPKDWPDHNKEQRTYRQAALKRQVNNTLEAVAERKRQRNERARRTEAKEFRRTHPIRDWPSRTKEQRRYVDAAYRKLQRNGDVREFLENRLAGIFREAREYIEEQPQAVLLEQAHNGSARTYVITNTRVTDELTFLERCKNEVFRVWRENIPSKVALKLHCKFEHWNVGQGRVDEIVLEFFSTRQFANIPGISMEGTWDAAVETLGRHIANYQKNKSDWHIRTIIELHIAVARYNPLGGSRWIELPKSLKNKQAVINMENTDDECFKWAITRFLNPVEKHGGRVTKLFKKQAEEQFCWDGINFPATERDIRIFERKNPSIRLMVYTFAEDGKTITPLWISSKTEGKKVILFLYKNEDGASHYMPVVNRSALLTKQVG